MAKRPVARQKRVTKNGTGVKKVGAPMKGKAKK